MRKNLIIADVLECPASKTHLCYVESVTPKLVKAFGSPDKHWDFIIRFAASESGELKDNNSYLRYSRDDKDNTVVVYDQEIHLSLPQINRLIRIGAIPTVKMMIDCGVPVTNPSAWTPIGRQDADGCCGKIMFTVESHHQGDSYEVKDNNGVIHTEFYENDCSHINIKMIDACKTGKALAKAAYLANVSGIDILSSDVLTKARIVRVGNKITVAKQEELEDSDKALRAAGLE